MSKYKIKYIDYIDGKYKEQYPGQSKLTMFLAFPKYKVTNQKTKNVFLLEDKWLTTIFEVVHSGVSGNHKRRIQVKYDQHYENHIIPFGIHVSGDFSSYIFFSNNNFLKKNNSITSIWINYEMIILHIMENTNIKYKTKINFENEYIYITSNFEDFIFKKESFIEINKYDERILKIKDNLKMFSKVKDAKKDIKSINEQKITDRSLTLFSNTNQENNEINNGRKAEKLVYDKLSSNLSWSQVSFNIEKLTSVDWININEEQYKPYDLIINKNIYIDVKGTWESRASFIITENENAFRKQIIAENNKYFIVNVLEIEKSSEHIMLIFDDELILKLNEQIKKQYIYKGEK